MKFTRLLLASVLVALAGLPVRAEDHVLKVAEDLAVTLQLPAGWVCEEDPDPAGPATARLSDGAASVLLQLSVAPDAEGQLQDEEKLDLASRQIAAPYLADSVEKQPRFERLAARVGRGLFCVLRDAKLADREDVPEGEYRCVTVGVRAVRGWYVVFSLLSQDTASPAYREALDLLRSGMTTAGRRRPARDPQAF